MTLPQGHCISGDDLEATLHRMKQTPLPSVDQQALNFIATIDTTKRSQLEKLLSIINNDIEHNALLPLSKLKSVHFCRFVILPGFQEVPDQLLYSVNYDGSLKDHLDDITQPATVQGFVQVLSCCLNYDSNLSHEDGIASFIRAHKKKVNTFYRGHRGYSLNLIRKQQSIYLAIQGFLNQTDTSALSPGQLRDNIINHVEAKFPDWKAPAIKHTFFPAAVVVIIFLLLPLLLLLGLSLAIQPWLLAAVVTLLVLTVLYFRRLEKNASEVPESEIDNYDPAKHLASIEDFQIQNQLTHLVEVRNNFLRRIVQKLVLYLLQNLVLFTHNKGALGSITSIHFARWVLIDNNRRLLFLSNYDGNWESYIGDFIDRNADGLTLAWSNTHEFPKTRWLVKDGATNEEIFKAWIRKNQLPTQVWYTAYKDLTVKNILRHHMIIRKMEQVTTETEIVNWLKLL